MLFLDGVYTTTPWGNSRFYRTNAPDQQERKVFTLQTIPAWEDDNRFAHGAQ
jgi:hypothetical protein